MKEKFKKQKTQSIKNLMEFQGDFLSWKGIMVSPFEKIANFQHLNDEDLE